MSFHTYEDLCYDLASSCDPLIRGTTTTAHHEYDTNWTSRAIGRSSMITGHNASTLARPHRPFLERKVAGPSPSASCRASSADGRSQPTGIETVFRQPDSRFRPSVGTSEPRARLQRPLPSRITRTWMHPALQDESHPAAADLYILFFFSIFPWSHRPPGPPHLFGFFFRLVWRALRPDGRSEEFVTIPGEGKGLSGPPPTHSEGLGPLHRK